MNNEMSDRADHAQMIDDCESRDSKLSDWERGFLDEIKGVLARGGQLSAERHAKLDEIWDRVT